MSYDWVAGIVLLLTIIAIPWLGKRLAFRRPDLQRLRTRNEAMDAQKRRKMRYPPMIRATSQVGFAMNLAFLLLAPFVVTLSPRPIWQSLLEIVAILMVFDFLYYLTHRFVFHGNLMRRIHAVHHEVRDPSYIDALYVHPLETGIGLLLFFGTALLLPSFFGPFGVFSLAIAAIVFTQINTINHTHFNLPYFPFRTLDYLTTQHHKHHGSMDRGNYATLTMTYDYLFGTIE